MISRRKMFGFVAAAPVAAIGVGTAKAEANNAPPRPIMTLSSGDPTKRMLLTARGEIEERKDISFGVGKDGHLWIQTSDFVWKRVSTDG